MRLNRAPVLLPADWLAGEVAERLGLDGGHHRAHLAALHAARAADEKAFVARFQDIWRERAFPPRTDPDQMLYDGFVNDADRALCQQILKQEPAALATQSWPFTDARLPELLLRYRARNFPDSLSTDERDQWREHCQWQRQEGDFNQDIVYTGVSRGACARRHHASNHPCAGCIGAMGERPVSRGLIKATMTWMSWKRGLYQVAA